MSDPFGPYLLHNEHMLWSGRSARLLYISAVELPIAIIGSFLIMLGSLRFAQSLPAALPHSATIQYDAADSVGWSILLIVVGSILLLVVLGPIVVRAVGRQHTYYAVTERRALEVTALWRTRVRAAQLAAIPCFELAEHRNGLGTLRFQGTGSGPSTATARRTAVFTFADIANARHVYALVNGGRVYR